MKKHTLTHNKSYTLTFFFLLFVSHLVSHAQPPTFPKDGISTQKIDVYAFTNVTLHLDHATTLQNATLIIEKGKVKAHGINVKIPEGAIVQDLKGKHIYPAFIDMYADYGVAKPTKKSAESRSPQYESQRGSAYYWNDAIQPEVKAATLFATDEKAMKEYQKIGFGTVLTFQADGIMRGTGTLVNLANKKPHEITILAEAATFYSFDKGTSTMQYPSSLMGTIALIRQVFLDANWYAQNPQAETNLSLQAFLQNRNLPAIFEANDKLNILRAAAIGTEMQQRFILKGKGDEYQRIADIKATQSPLIVPISFPAAYDVEDSYNANLVELSDMWHWELAPTNLAKLQEANIPFAITAADLKDKKDFLPNLRKAVQYGLSEKDALKALTTTPAQLLKVEKQLGSLHNGKIANFFICDKSIFDKETTITENWVMGERYIIQTQNEKDIRGNYQMTTSNGLNAQLVIEGKPNALSFKIITKDTLEVAGSYTDQHYLSLQFKTEKKATQFWRLNGWQEGTNFSGHGSDTNGTPLTWKATFSSNFVEKNDKKTDVKDSVIIPTTAIRYPFLSYGWTEKPTAQKTLIRNATVWTCEKDGILKETDVLLENGKIAAIGKNLPATNAIIIEAKGKHLTAGIIDEHSHIAISRGVNEGGQAISAEVRIGDVINNEDINIYRQLAGGVTAAQLLHGSANPIGGQSALVKLRWGQMPEDMKIKNAAGFIKFALGENVKQANWGENYTTRYPQTRMGVEQIYYEAFTQAKEYEADWKKYNALDKKTKAITPAPQRDLEKEALVEILNKKRFISCHSYVQSEINMLMKVADSMGFTVNTFTHILEGYKVADKMKAHGAGGSTFSDWWAYKMEVKDAIPYNAAMMHKVGVTTAINSDDAEMGRRLNQEAAKSVKYGGVSEEEALKMVTLNPAKLLKLDQQTGSIKIGKDADVVLWNDHPLSIYATVSHTWVDGINYYNQAKDQEMQKMIQTERNRLIQAMLQSKKDGKPTTKPTPKTKNKIWHCEEIGCVH
jgi:imidazolonepropionase-like amidohydrolase